MIEKESTPVEGVAPDRQIQRRTVAKGLAWSVPAITVAAGAPAASASIRNDPGINGWMTGSYSSDWNCNFTFSTTSRGSGATPDGAPWGLFIYDADDDDVYTNAQITFWWIGTQSTGSSWTPLTNHSSCWSTPVRGTPAVKSDGHSYTPWTTTYNCQIDATNRVTGADGIERVFLGDFHMRFSGRQTTSRYCRTETWWGERAITLDPDGPGPEQPTRPSFERRAGDNPGTPPGVNRQAQTTSEAAGVEDAGGSASY